MLPILKHLGGKKLEIRHFEHLVPTHYDRYYEPFFGGGAVFWHLARPHSVISDLNENIINFYLELKHNAEQVRADIAILKEYHDSLETMDAKKAFYYEVRDAVNGLESQFIGLNKWALFFTLNKMAFHGIVRYKKNGDINSHYGFKGKFHGAYLLDENLELLKTTEILCADYQDALSTATENDFVFLDPPYDCIENKYGNGAKWKEQDFIRLKSYLSAVPFKYIMTINSTELTRDLFGGQVKDKYYKHYCFNQNKRKQAGEDTLIITNY